MSIVVIGVNHRTSPLSVLERVTLSQDDQVKAVHSLVSRSNLNEAVVLSTCNRTEVYAVAEKFHGAYGDIQQFFSELSGLSTDELQAHIYNQHDSAAVTHLFEVAAGLDSAVLGETEILGQVKQAWDLARVEGGVRTTLNMLFRHALEVGKRARTETSISRHTASVSHAAVEMTAELLGDLANQRVLVVGAGEMGEGVANALQHAGAGDITVVNRTPARAVEIAERIGASVRSFKELDKAMIESSVVLSCTGAGSLVIDREMTERVQQERDGAPLLVVDIAVPRDVDPSVESVDGVMLRNLDHLRDWAARGLALRENEASMVREIIVDEVDRFNTELTARQAAPLVSELYERAENVRLAELDRLSSKLNGLSSDQLDAVDALTKGIVAKLLHQVSVRLKEDAGTPQGERNAAAVRDLFNLH